MPADQKQLSPTDQLAAIQLEIATVQLEEARQRLELTKHNVQQFKDSQEHYARMQAHRKQVIEQNTADRLRTQKRCKHKTGGQNREGFFNGDGEHGYCVNKQQLPTGEWYCLCLRCQKEWHDPVWTVKIEFLTLGKVSMTRAQFDKLREEFEETWNWPAKDLQPSEASLFRIPRLDMIDVEKLEFAAA